MLSWIFKRRSLPKKKKHESIRRVQNILLTPTIKSEKFFSPTLQQLQCGDIKNVKELSSIYEDNDKADEMLCNRLAATTPLSSRKLMPAFEKLDKSPDSIVLDLCRSILDMDMKYLKHMQKLLDSYIKELEFEARFVEESERNELVTSVFGNIKAIYEIHLSEFQPFIQTCVDEKSPDISIQIYNFANKLITLCKDGTFNPYLLHAMIEKESTAKRDNFYNHLVTYAEQKYQFSYSFDPISQIQQYADIIEEIFKEIHKQKVTLKSVEKMTYAMQEFNKEMSKIKAAMKYN